MISDNLVSWDFCRVPKQAALPDSDLRRRLDGRYLRGTESGEVEADRQGKSPRSAEGVRAPRTPLACFLQLNRRHGYYSSLRP